MLTPKHHSSFYLSFKKYIKGLRLEPTQKKRVSERIELNQLKFMSRFKKLKLIVLLIFCHFQITFCNKDGERVRGEGESEVKDFKYGRVVGG